MRMGERGEVPSVVGIKQSLISTLYKFGLLSLRKRACTMHFRAHILKIVQSRAYNLYDYQKSLNMQCSSVDSAVASGGLWRSLCITMARLHAVLKCGFGRCKRRALGLILELSLRSEVNYYYNLFDLRMILRYF